MNRTWVLNHLHLIKNTQVLTTNHADRMKVYHDNLHFFDSNLNLNPVTQ